MPGLLETILHKSGPMLSSEVAVQLAKAANLTPEAARKRLSRAVPPVRRLAGVSFPRNARFMYLDKQFGSSSYWHSLSRALIDTNSALGYAIASLQQCGGIIPARQFPIICGAPVRQRKHLSVDTVLQNLGDAGLVKSTIIPALGDCIALVQDEEFYGVRSDEMRARLMTEGILLSAVKDWLRNLGIASYNLVSMRDADPLPQVGTMVWDLAAPSYLGHMVRQSREGELKPGFVVCDVNLSRMTMAGATPFIRKCVTLRALHNVGPCMQMIVAREFDNDAFRALRGAGIIAATPGTLFGAEVANALRELSSVLLAAAHSWFDSDKFEQLFKALAKIEGAGYQLRGTLFEYMVADAARRLHHGEVWMSRIFKNEKNKAEVDVLAVRANHSITAIECKGYSPRSIIPDDDFRRWLQHNVPVAYKGIRDHPDWRNLRVGFEFWTTAPISDDAMALFDRVKVGLNEDRYSITLRGPSDVQQACRDTGEPTLIRAFAKHFTLHDGTVPPRSRTPWRADNQAS